MQHGARLRLSSYSATLRVRLENEPGAFGRVATAVGEAGGLLGSIDLVRVETDHKVRDVTIMATDEGHIERVVAAVRSLAGWTWRGVSDRTFLAHLGGKLRGRGLMPASRSSRAGHR